MRKPLLTTPRLLLLAAAILIVAVVIQDRMNRVHAEAQHAAFVEKLKRGGLGIDEFIANCGRPRLRRTSADGKTLLVYDIDALSAVDVTFNPDGTRTYLYDEAHVSRTGKVTGGKVKVQESEALGHLPEPCGRWE